MKFKSYLILAILLLTAIILIQNTEVVEFKIFFWQISMSRIILFPALLVIGFIVGYIIAKVHRHKRVKEKLAKPCAENPKGREND
ncbi:MAG: LapA family protein [Candidatus Cloacimonadales bacterium]|nr:LapA family protein [Candidatus Cloacimonadales bacterium]